MVFFVTSVHTAFTMYYGPAHWCVRYGLKWSLTYKEHAFGLILFLKLVLITLYSSHRHQNSQDLTKGFHMIYAFVFFACFQRGLSFVLMSRPVDPALLIPIDIVEEFPVSCWKSSRKATSSALKRLLQCVGHKIVAEILATQDAINLFPKLFSPLIPGQNAKGKIIIKIWIFHQHVISSSGRQLHYQPQLEAQGHQQNQVMCST